MKRSLKLLFSVLISAFFALNIYAQCLNTSQYPGGTITVGACSGVQTINTCNFVSEYTQLGGMVSGSTYRFTHTSGTTHYYVTVRTNAGALLAHGASPFSWTSTVNGDVRVHWSNDAVCTPTPGGCRTTTVECTSCAPAVQGLITTAPTIGAGIMGAGGTATVSGNTACSGPAQNVPTCGISLNTANGQWYTFTTGNCQGDMILDLCTGTSFDSKLAVFTGTINPQNPLDFSGLTCVASDDDSCPIGLQSSLGFTTITNTTYYVYVTGFSTNTGGFTLTMNLTIDPCCSAPALTANFVPPTFTVCPGEPFSGSLVISGGIPFDNNYPLYSGVTNGLGFDGLGGGRVFGGLGTDGSVLFNAAAAGTTGAIGGTYVRNVPSTSPNDLNAPFYFNSWNGITTPGTLSRYQNGVVTVVGQTPAGTAGIAYDRFTGNIYASTFALTGPGQLYRINPNTFASTLVGSFDGAGWQGWAFLVVVDDNGQLYVSDAFGNEDRLWKVNKTNAQVELVGGMGYSSGTSFHDAFYKDGAIHNLAFDQNFFEIQYRSIDTQTAASTVIATYPASQVGAAGWNGVANPNPYQVTWSSTDGLTLNDDGSFTGEIFTPGVYTYTVTVTDACGNQTTAQMVVTVLNTPDAFACNDHVNISVQQDCAIDFRADMFNEGPYGGCYDNYEVYIWPLGNANHPQASINVNNKTVTFPTAWINKTHTFVVKNPFTGNQCWGTFTAEDKIGPTIDCSSVTPVIIECWESAAPQVLNRYPLFDDNCSNTVLTSTDQVVTSYCAEYVETIYRTWTVTDNNNGMTASCVQVIYKKRATLANLGVPPNWDGVQNDMIECSKGDAGYPLNQWGNPHPSYTGGPTGIGWTPTSSTGACGTIEVFYNDRVFQSDCGPKILRDWTIIDDCTGQIVTHTQIIRISDTTPPTVCGPVEVLEGQVPIVISTNAWSCTGDYIVPKPLICDNCDLNATYTVTSSAGTPIYIPSTKTWIIFGMPEGIHAITYLVRDWCGNLGTHTFFVTVEDRIPPMAACEQYKQVSLTFDGTNSVAKVWAQSFDSGSHDHGCGPVWFKVLREGCAFNIDKPNEIAANKAYFDDEVYYCCGDALIMTTLRVFDVNPGPGAITPSRMLPGGDLYGHFNDCMTTVDVQEKVPPVMLCQDVTITCEDNIHPDFTGYPIAYATCGTPLFKYTDKNKLNSCNIGTIERTWEILKADGSSYNPKITCLQIITVEETLPFDPLTIIWPAESSEHCLKNEPLGGKPYWETNPCNIVEYSLIKVDTFRFVDGACYKILREWAVVDWCVYEPNTGAEWNLDEFRIINGAGNTGAGVLKHARLDAKFFEEEDRDGYYRFTEVIMIYDNTPANIHVEDACIGIATCVTAPETHKFTATSSEDDADCGGEYEWTYVVHDVCCNVVIQFSSNNNAYKGANFQGGVSGKSSLDKLKGADAEFTLLPSLAVGEYRVTWTLRDGCGNVNEEYQYITVADKKAPTPFMVDISTATMTNCMVEMTARFFDKGACNNQCLASYDNCSDVLYFTFTPVLPKLDPSWTLDAYGLYYFNPTSGAKSNRAAYLAGNAHSWNPVKNTSGQVFTGPTRTVNVDVYVWDKFALNEDCDDGNYDFATVLVTINSIDDDCNGPVFPLNGMIAAKANGAGINNVSVEAKKDGESRYTTTANGAYTVNVPGGMNVVTPSKKDDYTNGVSTLDLVLIQKHLLGLGALNADQLVAADANANNSVTGADIKQLRDLILGVNNVLPSNDSWVFAPKSAEINMNAAASLNFSGIKVGDINGDAKANFDGTSVNTRNANVINMVVNEAAVEAGNEIEVAFTAENFNNVRGTQMTLNLNGLSFAGVNAGAMDVTAENFGLIRDGIVTMSWNNANGATVTDGAVLFTLKLNANVNGNLSNLMSAGSQITAAEAYTTDALNVNGLNVTFRGTEEVVFELYQNEPNPFAEKTVVGFNLPEAGEYTLNVYDVTGRVLKTVNSNGVKGYNKVELNSNDLSAGVLYYQLDSNNFTATKRMIVIK